MFSSPSQRLSIAIGLFALTSCSADSSGTAEQSSEAARNEADEA